MSTHIRASFFLSSATKCDAPLKQQSVELEGVIWCVWKSVDWSLYIFHLCKVAVYSVSVLEQYDKQVKESIERLDISFRIYNVI